jgi:hypothetical protein
MFNTKAIKADLEAKLAQVKKDAEKAAQTLRDRVANLEKTAEALVKADAPVVAADITKIAADLAAVVTRVEALEATAKVKGLQEAATAAANITKAASKAKAASKVEVAAPAAEAVTEKA